MERFILGGSFSLLIIFGILLMLLKNGLEQNKKMHSYLGVSVILTACSILCMYLELEFPGSIVFDDVKIVFALIAIIIYAIIGYNIGFFIFRKIRVATRHNSTQSKESETISQPAPKEEIVKEAENDEEKVEEKEEETEEEVIEESPEEDDKDATDENGQLIRQPSVDNMDDIIFFQRLEALMAKKKLFSEQEITREQIAAEIGTNRTYLIRSIKLATGMTFNEYINSLRVNYAATLLITSDEPLDLIGTIAGFRSKSTYYRAFQAANNCSPAEYRNRHK